MPFGLEIIEGLMGAGKSYYAVRRVCQVIEETRRPVYTNLPMKWPVVRAYLRNRGGEELASLIHPLKETHWRNFLKRQHMHAQFREERGGRTPSQLNPEELNELAAATGKTPERLTRQTKIQSSQMWDWFHHVYGEDEYEGTNADSIPLTAVIVIDEVQHWHPMLKQGKDPYSEHLQAYLTMCRHHVHWVWVITQDRTRINILFRNLASSVWRVWNRGEDRLVWGIRFKHFGMRGMGYERYTKDQLEGRNSEDVKAVESFTVLSQLPRNRVYYRLYDSFTNVGSSRQIQKLLEQTRKKAGLAADGTTEQERKAQEQQEMKSTQKRPFYRRFITGTIKLTIVMVLVFVSFGIGTSINPEIVEIFENEEQAPDPHNWPKFNGISSGKPLFNGKFTTVGGQVGDRGELAYFDAARRTCVLTADDGYWVWLFGQDAPEPIGTINDIQTAYSRMVKAEEIRAGIQDEGTADSQTVGDRDGINTGQ